MGIHIIFESVTCPPLSNAAITLLNIASFRMFHLLRYCIFLCVSFGWDYKFFVCSGLSFVNWRTGTRNMDKELGPRTISVERGTRTLNMDLEPGLQDTDVDLWDLMRTFMFHVYMFTLNLIFDKLMSKHAIVEKKMLSCDTVERRGLADKSCDYNCYGCNMKFF